MCICAVQPNAYKLPFVILKLFLCCVFSQILSALLAKKARFLEPSVAADMLTFFVHFGLPSSNLVVKVYLQLMMKHMNNLPLDQLATLAYNLGQLEVTEQIKVLLQALKVLCSTRKYQLATISTEHCIFLLNAFGADLDFCNELVKVLWRDRFEFARPDTPVAVLSALGAMCGSTVNKSANRVMRHKRLENWCIDQSLRYLPKLGVHDFVSLLVACKKLRLYNSELLNAVGQQLSNDAYSLTDRLSAWLRLVELGYLHSGLSQTILGNVDRDTVQSLSMEHCVAVLRLTAEHVCIARGVTSHEEVQVVGSSVDDVLESVQERILSLCQSSSDQPTPGYFKSSESHLAMCSTLLTAFSHC